MVVFNKLCEIAQIQLAHKTVSNALLKHFYFSLSTAVKHVLADFCNAPSVRL